MPAPNGNKDGHPILGRRLTLGQRAADRLTLVVGSWKFIISLFVLMAVWVMVNTYALFTAGWDPYPFILFNLVLSCLAAVQAPIILMSQNRVTERDRITAKYDYNVDRKAEKEIRGMQKDLDEIKRMLGGSR